MNTPDQDIIFRFWLRDHRALIFKVLNGFCKQEGDRQDLFQEIALQLWRSIPTFNGKSRESTWIYKVALNTALTWNRKEQKRRSVLQPTEDIHLHPSSNTEEIPEKLAWLYSEIRKLDKIDRALILLYLDGMSYLEMAEMLGISETNVGVKLNRIKKALILRSKRS